jgi:hypothetical protein
MQGMAQSLHHNVLSVFSLGQPRRHATGGGLSWVPESRKGSDAEGSEYADARRTLL